MIEEKTGVAHWLQENWRSIAFVVYGLICVCDFVIMPLAFQFFNQHLDASTLVNLSLQSKDPAVQQQIIQTFGARLSWVPLTLQGGGTFHLSFGSLLTAAGWQRGQEKIEQIKASNPSQ